MQRDSGSHLGLPGGMSSFWPLAVLVCAKLGSFGRQHIIEGAQRVT